MVKVGDPLPVFIPEAQGKTCIIYFYPKDDTPGCTTEACGFRDEMERLSSKGVQVIGISPDTTESHEKFISKYQLNFILLPDIDKKIATAFGIVTEKKLLGLIKIGIERSTFIVNDKGVIIWMERNVSVFGHVERVCSAVEMLV